MERVRIGFVGVGGMGQAAHLRNYLTLPDCDVVAIAEIRPKLGQKVAARYGVPKVYGGHRELLAAERLDGIVAIQPFGLHAALVPELLEKRVPVLTEKPLADSVENGERIAAAAARTGTPLYLAYHKRSDPAVLYAKRQTEQWVESGEVGKLKYVRAAMPPGDWAAQGFSQLLTTDEKYDAGPSASDRYTAFVNYYIHQVNLIRFLLGHDYEVAYADPGDVLLVGRGSGGATVALEMGTHTTTLDWQEEAFVAFERGWVKVELPAPLAVDRPGRVTVFCDPGGGQTPTTTVPTMPWVHAMRQQAAQFVKAIKGEKTTLCEAAEGLKDLRVAREYVRMLETSDSKTSAEK